MCRSGRRNPTNSQQQKIRNVESQFRTIQLSTESDSDSRVKQLFFALSRTYNTKSTKKSNNRVKRNFHANVSLGKLGVGIKRGTGMAEWRNGIAERNGGTNR